MDNRPASPQSREKDPLKLNQLLYGEPPDPGEGTGLGPAWMWVLIIFAVFVGGFYFGRHFGVFGTTAHIGYLTPGSSIASQNAAEGTKAVSGAAVFASHCATCHQSSGQGLPGAFPPLAGSEYVLGDPTRMVSIILDGLQGPVSVKGATFNGHMPAWKSQLNDSEIAAVASHVRSTWGNKASPITPDFVKKVRTAYGKRSTPWTVQELQSISTKGP